MNGETQEYIHNVKVEDIPWHRITTTYGRATDFPKYWQIDKHSHLLIDKICHYDKKQ